MRGRICNSQLLLVLASAIFQSELHETRYQILLSQIWHSTNLVGQVSTRDHVELKFKATPPIIRIRCV
jgi:hypothetical protein